MALSDPFSDEFCNIAVFRTYHNYAEWLFIPANRRYCNYYRHAITPGDIHCLLPRASAHREVFVSARRCMALVLTSLVDRPVCLNKSRLVSALNTRYRFKR
jgi:hypothetical protein